MKIGLHRYEPVNNADRSTLGQVVVVALTTLVLPDKEFRYLSTVHRCYSQHCAVGRFISDRLSRSPVRSDYIIDDKYAIVRRIVSEDSFCCVASLPAAIHLVAQKHYTSPIICL